MDADDEMTVRTIALGMAVFYAAGIGSVTPAGVLGAATLFQKFIETGETP